MRYALFFLALLLFIGCTEKLNDEKVYIGEILEVVFTYNGEIIDSPDLWIYDSKEDLQNNRYSDFISLDYPDQRVSINLQTDSVWIKCLKITREFTYEKIQKIEFADHDKYMVPEYTVFFDADIRETSYKIKQITLSSGSFPTYKKVRYTPYGNFTDNWDESYADDLTGVNPDIYLVVEGQYTSNKFGDVDYDYSHSLIYPIPNTTINKDTQLSVKLMDYDFNVSPDDLITSCTISLPNPQYDHFYPGMRIYYNNFSVDIELQ
jgi:hypothetical protein